MNTQQTQKGFTLIELMIVSQLLVFWPPLHCRLTVTTQCERSYVRSY